MSSLGLGKYCRFCKDLTSFPIAQFLKPFGSFKAYNKLAYRIQPVTNLTFFVSTYQ